MSNEPNRELPHLNVVDPNVQRIVELAGSQSQFWSRRIVDRILRRYYRWSSLRFCRREAYVRPCRAIVSFSFDDFPRSAAANGGPVLNDLNIRGTYFVSFGLAARPTSGGLAFTLDDLRGVIQCGHELGCHTFGHELSHCVSSRRYEESIRRNQEHLRQIGPHCTWRAFAYPAGSVSPQTKRIVQNRFPCGRGTAPGMNVGWTDLNLLRANSLYSDQRPVGHQLTLIRQAVETRGWLIFYTHDVQETPSRFGCTPEYLRQVAQGALDQGADVLPIGEALQTIHSVERAS